MRVITPYGFGTAHDWRSGGARVAVELDKPFAGTTAHTLERRGQVFLFTDWATARVINIPTDLNLRTHLLLSNFQFHETQLSARVALRLPSPPDETRFAFDLAFGKVRICQSLGWGDPEFVLMRPWLDRWGKEETNVFETAEEAVTAFDAEAEGLAGAGGVSTMFVIDVERRRLLRFAMFTEPLHGAVLSLKYEGDTEWRRHESTT